MFSSAGLWKSVTKHRVRSNETFKQLIGESFLGAHRLLAEQGAAERVGRGLLHLYYAYRINLHSTKCQASFISQFLTPAFTLECCSSHGALASVWKQKYRSHLTVLVILPPSLISTFRPLTSWVDQCRLIITVNSNNPSAHRTAARYSSPLPLSWGQSHSICPILWVCVDADISKLLPRVVCISPFYSSYFSSFFSLLVLSLIPISAHSLSLFPAWRKILSWSLSGEYKCN